MVEYTTTYQYLAPESKLPTQIRRPSVASSKQSVTIIDYDAGQNPQTITQTGFTPDGAPVSRTVSLQYNSVSQITAIDGPRSDVSDITNLSYYTNDAAQGNNRGQLKSATNAKGHSVTYDSYDAHGRLLQMTDANGVKTAYTYDARGRVLTVTQTPATGSPRSTVFTYDGVGQLKTVTTPDGATLTYGYNAAHYLTAVTDNLGNKIEYGYDLKGNRTQEKTFDPDSTLVRTIEATYDTRDFLKTLNTAGSVTQLIFDEVGNLKEETDPNNNPNTQHDYDALDRLLKTTDRLTGVTEYRYDTNDNLIQIKAPNNATTTYDYDDLGNQLKEVSPDRGTLIYTYDEAGNVITKTDARNITATYGYDALGRLTTIDLPGTNEDVSFSYDTCANGKGRLCQITDQSGVTSYGYDAFGNIATQSKTELGQTYSTSYAYDAADRITGITYPDGRTVTYTRDSIGRTTGINATVNGTDTPIASNLHYRADGLLTDRTWQNGLAETRQYDQQGRLIQQDLGTLDSRSYGYDANGNMLSKSRNTDTDSYGYDPLDRLTTDTSTIAGAIAYSYDLNGNRLTKQIDAAVEQYLYEQNSNKLTEKAGTPIVLDAAGNTTDNGTYQFSYNNAGRLSQVHQAGTLIATYTYNALGQRTRKVTTSGTVTTTTLYHYDLFGTLINETTATGQKQRAYLWHNGSPIAQIDSSGTTETLVLLHTDHLATARMATNAAGSIIWRWEGEAFGATPPQEDIDNDGISTIVNLRFPGQYYDAETGLYYNYSRCSDPSIGRYITSGPSGLDGSYIYLVKAVSRKNIVI